MADESNKTEAEAEVKLEEATQERLDAIFDGDSTPSGTEPEPEPASEPAADESGEPSDSTPSGTEPEPESASEPAADEPEGVSDAYYRAAKHQGWSDEEITNLHNANPELANKTFAKLLESTNRISQEFAAMGRARQQQNVIRPESKKDDGQQKSKSKGIDIEQLKKDYDNDPIIEVVAELKRQNDELIGKIDKLGTPVVQTSEDELRVKLQQEEIVQQQVEQYFKADDLKSYSDFYGLIPKGSKGWDGLTTEQKTNRWAVLELAEQILTGAEMQGRKMDVDEAMESAHLIVSEPIREKIIRESIKANVVKRNKGLTLKPNSGTAPAQTGPASQATLEARTTERLRKVFG